MSTLFGTDGIRGVANVDLTAEVALGVGRAVAIACLRGLLGARPEGRPVVVVGRDTRPSGPMLSDALAAGLRSAGADVRDVGVIPSPGVAMLVADDVDVAGGVIVSASHNPADDNGIKLLGSDGGKLEESVERQIEELISSPRQPEVGSGIGGDSPAAHEPVQRYVELVCGLVDVDLRGRRVVVDCANGAAHRSAPMALRRLGAEVIALNAPTGTDRAGDRINAGCGATHPEVVAEAARAHSAIGLTLDGDADRVLAADEDGRIVDGDGILAVLARTLRDRGQLVGDAIAVTVMSNQALRGWCSEAGIGIVETPVGDRNVLAAMRDRGLILGGEQSGHVLRLDLAPTGDGLLTGLCLLESVVASGDRLADIVPFRPLPQVLVNVAISGRDRLGSAAVQEAVRTAESRLDGRGRILIRPSGTEPLVRVMVEASDAELAGSIAAELVSAVEQALED